MSAVIPPVAPVDADSSSIKPVPVSENPVNTVSNGSNVAVTTPDSSPTNPVVIQLPTTGTVTIAPATPGANVAIRGDGNATVNIGIAQDSSGGVQNGSGSTIQVDNGYQGSVIANLAGAVVDGPNVDTSTDTGFGTIADNAPTGASGIDYYINTGAGADQIEGSRGNDFIRAGAGNDTVNAGAGNDVVRLGSGDDQVTLGSGDDIVYFTVDQLQGTQSKTITDFDTNGNDKIQIDADLQGLVSITGQGTNKITISLSGSQVGTTTVESGGQTIDNDDIEFV